MSTAAASGCANEGARAETGSLALADCRAYEQVTPGFKQGVAAGAPLISADGSRLIVNALGLFAGEERATGLGGIGSEGGVGGEYELARGDGGWTTTPVPAPSTAEFPVAGMQNDASPGLSSTLWKLTSPSQRAGEGDLYRREANGQLAHLGPLQPPGEAPRFGNEGSYLGASQDLRQVLVEKAEDQGRWPGDTTSGPDSLYDYAGVEEPEPKLVGVSNSGPLRSNDEAQLISGCGTALGGVQGSQQTDAYNAIAADGETVFFTALACGGSPAINELYARIGGASTVAVSEPLLAPGQCSGACAAAKSSEAIFQGASADGSEAYFTTDQPLLNGDEAGTGTGRDLYAAELGGGAVERLVQVSHDPNPGDAAEVVGVARVSEDGSRVYYVAKGVLTTTPNGNGETAEQDAYNLYVYDNGTGAAAEGTAFVATLLSSREAGELKRGVEGGEAATAEREAVAEKALALAREREQIETARGEIAAQESRCEGLSGSEHDRCESELEELEDRLVGLIGELPELETELQEAEAEFSQYVSSQLSIAVAASDGLSSADAGRPFSTTPDGRFLLFVGARELAGTGDTSPGRQVFEYDAQSGQLQLVSLGQHSFSEALEPKIVEPDYREVDRATEANSTLSISDDGAYAFFESPDALAPQAASDEYLACLSEGQEHASEAQCTAPAYAQNVYQYHEGRVSLIATLRDSSGGALQRLLGTDHSGDDVFFTTVEPLLRGDTDTQIDIYDARIGGGFAVPAAQPGCSGEACQGPPSPPPPLPTPESGALTAAGDLAPPLTQAPHAVSVAPKPGALTRSQKLARALRACAKEPRRKRPQCRRQASRRYATRSKASRSRPRVVAHIRRGR
jgi:hypothetical protein